MNLLTLLSAARKHDASDIHIVVGVPPLFRVNGEIVAAKGEPITPEQSRSLALEGLNDTQRQRLEQTLQLCHSLLFNGGDRARVTIYHRQGTPELSIRMSQPSIRTRGELNLPPLVDEMARKPNGLFIITGPTGTGKTTTFHYMIDLINTEQRVKIITIEDPVEYTHSFKRGIVIQQEILTDVHDFNSALVHGLRQDPDVICVGEMREPAAMYTALMAAETGHLVIATLHTPGAAEAMQRIVSAFPEGQQSEIRNLLASCLQGVISQVLLPRATTAGLILCYETLVGTLGVRNQIRSNESHQLYSEIQSGQRLGMITLDRCLMDLYQKGEITYDTALSAAKFPDQFKERMS